MDEDSRDLKVNLLADSYPPLKELSKDGFKSYFGNETNQEISCLVSEKMKENIRKREKKTSSESLIPYQILSILQNETRDSHSVTELSI